MVGANWTVEDKVYIKHQYNQVIHLEIEETLVINMLTKLYDRSTEAKWCLIWNHEHEKQWGGDGLTPISPKTITYNNVDLSPI